MGDSIGLTSARADSDVDEFAVFRNVLQTRILFRPIVDLPVTRVLSIPKKCYHQISKLYYILLSLTGSTARLKFFISFYSIENV